MKQRVGLFRGAIAALVVAGGAAGGAAHGAEVTVLSAGAVEPGLKPVLTQFEAQGGHHVALSFAAAPALRQRIGADPALADLVIAPTAVLDELTAAGKLAPSERRVLGRVGIGVAVRPGASKPDISNAEALKAALVGAESVVYNRASTGLYVEGLIERWGLADTLRARTTRYPDGASVMQHVLRGHGREIGLGATTEIALLANEGLVFVGPLPPEVQNTTTYEATLTERGRRNPAAAALLATLGSPAAIARMRAAGIGE